MRTIHGICAFIPLILTIYMVLAHLAILPMVDFPNGIYMIIVGLFIVAEILTLRMIYAPKKVSDGHKGLWTILVIVFNILILPLFWVIYVYPTGKKKKRHKKRK